MPEGDTLPLLSAVGAWVYLSTMSVGAEPSTDSCWYFAYGANTNPSVLQGRRKIQPESAEHATLDGFRLTFNLRGIPLVEPVFANIEPAPDAQVHGVLYRLKPEAQARLDMLEGEGKYYRSVDVDVTGDDSGVVRAKAYFGLKTRSAGRPSRRYLELLIDGGQHHGFPAEYLEFLAKQPTRHVPVLSWALARLLPVLDRIRGL